MINIHFGMKHTHIHTHKKKLINFHEKKRDLFLFTIFPNEPSAGSCW